MHRRALIASATALLGSLAAAAQITMETPDVIVPTRPEDRNHDYSSEEARHRELLKSEHEHAVQDAHHLVELAQALEKDIQDAGVHVLSVSSLHRADEIEKLAKKIRSRMRGY